jgi:hypothetical protein
LLFLYVWGCQLLYFNRASVAAVHCNSVFTASSTQLSAHKTGFPFPSASPSRLGTLICQHPLKKNLKGINSSQSLIENQPMKGWRIEAKIFFAYSKKIVAESRNRC